jgi:hypothetical protein
MQRATLAPSDNALRIDLAAYMLLAQEKERIGGAAFVFAGPSAPRRK